MPNTQDVTIIYHASCLDGFCSAYVLWMKHGEDFTEYLPVHYGQPAPEAQGNQLYIVDFSYDLEVLEQYARNFDQVVVLDHHKSAVEKLITQAKEATGYDIQESGQETIIQKHKLFIKLNMEKSGARLTWEFMNCSMGSGNVEALVQYTEDRDLWNWKYPATINVDRALRATDWNFGVWAELDISELIDKGKVINEYLAHKIKGILKRTVGEDGAILTGVVTPFGFLPCLNNTHGDIISDLLHEICNLTGKPAMSWFYDGVAKKYRYSIRSTAECYIKARTVAEFYNGGGHENAAGFERELML
ncbi:MAG: hypothetical protein CL489_06280 [Acidobacteria bacterium]|nr:hypothetical protein [Acidobacteriota bacterium]